MASNIFIEYKSIWPIDETLTDTTTPGQSRSGSNGNEGVLHRSLELEPYYQMPFSVIPWIP